MAYFTVADPGEGPGGAAPLFFNQTEFRRAKTIFLKTTPPLYLRVWTTGAPSSEGVWIRRRFKRKHSRPFYLTKHLCNVMSFLNLFFVGFIHFVQFKLSK